MVVHVKTYNRTFANPFLVCEADGKQVITVANNKNIPCGCRVGVGTRSVCVSWGPVGGCRCTIKCEVPS